jgi:hypothetical protein
MPTTSRRHPRPTDPGAAFPRPRRAGSARGQALVEVAIMLPVALLLLAMAADLARVFGSRVTIEGAARAGALEAARHPTSFQAGLPCDASVNRVMCAVLTESHDSFVTVGPADVSLVCTPSPCAESLGSQVAVSVVGHFALLTPILAPFMGGQAFDVTSDAVAQIAVHPAILGSSPSPGPTPSPTPSPTPTPAPTPTPDPSATPGPTPTPSPSPSPTPVCFSPVADFSLSPSSGKKKKTTFAFTDLSTTTAECPLTWSWNFGDGGGDSTSSLQNPTHVYQAQGTYTIALVVSNSGGSATRTRTVTVTP